MCYHDYNLITTSERRTSLNSETTIRWCSLKYNPALKSHPHLKVHMNYIGCFVSTSELFSTIRFNIKLLPFAKFAEFLRGSNVKAGIFIVFFFQPEVMLKLRLNFRESRPI